MGALAFWKAVVGDKSNFLERVIALLEDSGFPYCVIGGVAVNAYAEPVVTVDLDIVLTGSRLPEARRLLAGHFRVQDFEHSLDIYDPESKLQVQIQKDPDLDVILPRARRLDVLGLLLPVAAPRDLIRLKAAAALEPTRRRMKRGKDRLDIARLVTVFPELRDEIPSELLPDILELLDPEP